LIMIRCDQYLVFCIMLCGSLFVFINQLTTI